MMRHAVLLSFLIVLPSGSAGPAPAPAAPSEAAKAMVGKWEFSNADRDKICNIVFRTDSGAVGMKLEFEQACFGHFPFIKEIVGWRLGENDFLRLLNAKGRSVLEFSEVESRMFEAPRPGEGILFIQSLAAVAPDITAEQMNGDWAVVRGSGQDHLHAYALGARPWARVSHSRSTRGASRSSRASIRCHGVSNAAGSTLASARGDTWLFEADDPANWHRIPQTADPVLLVRK